MAPVIVFSAFDPDSLTEKATARVIREQAQRESKKAAQKKNIKKLAVTALIILIIGIILFFALYLLPKIIKTIKASIPTEYVGSSHSITIHRRYCHIADSIPKSDRVYYPDLQSALDDGRYRCLSCLGTEENPITSDYP